MYVQITQISYAMSKMLLEYKQSWVVQSDLWIRHNTEYKTERSSIPCGGMIAVLGWYGLPFRISHT